MGTRKERSIPYAVIVLLGACALWKNPETEVLSQLKACEAPRTWTLGHGEKQKRLKVEQMLFQRLTVVLEEDRKRAYVVGTLDLDGSWKAQTASAPSEKEQYIRSLGFERVEFVYEEGKWKAAQGCFPQLEAVLLFLSEQEAQETGEAMNTLGWSMRLEREEVRITQEFEKTLQGGGWRSFALKREAEGKLRNVDVPEVAL